MALALRMLRLRVPATAAAGGVYKGNTAARLFLEHQGQLQCLRLLSSTKSSRDNRITKTPRSPATKSFGDVGDVVSSKQISDSSSMKLTDADAGSELSTETSSTPTASNETKKLSTEGVRQNVKGYMFTRYLDIVKNYDTVLEKNFPSAVKVYRVFFDGVREFYADMKRYLKISRIVYSSPVGLGALNRKELELYMQMPRDMVKVAPALIGSSLPMVGYAIFPLVFMYPRTLLTSHFWNAQQRMEFQEYAIRDRLKFNRPVFRHLQAKQRIVRSQEYYSELKKALGLLGSGFHPSVDAILAIQDVFATAPFNIESLNGKHLKLLCQMHGLRTGWFKRERLYEHAFLVHHMDLAICREGGVHNMNPDALTKACYIRGLNPMLLNNDERIEWMRNWIKVSTAIKEQHISLFLHLPILLAYNHPNNWKLIY